MSYQFNIFISHSWQYSGHYETLAKWIFDENWILDDVNLNFYNESVPKDDPIHNAPNAKLLEDVINALIMRSNIVIVPTGMYASYSKWIEKELQGATRQHKPILAVNPWGQQRASNVVQRRATKTVGWNKKKVITGIVELCKR